MLKPVWLYVSYLPLSVKSTIALLGNPAVWWVGFAFIILVVERAVRKKDVACAFITAFFFFQWLPYVFISRVTFIYHFYVSVPFLCLASAYFINEYWSTKWGKVAAVAYFASVVVMFGLFYSVISGAPAPTSWIDSLKWLNGWGF
jgi:dolichyl-phosphate-mannose--protein O-mannosyl transferase